MDRCRYLCSMNEIFEKEDKTATPSRINILRYLNSIFGHWNRLSFRNNIFFTLTHSLSFLFFLLSREWISKEYRNDGTRLRNKRILFSYIGVYFIYDKKPHLCFEGRVLHAHVLNSQQLSHSSSGLSARNHLAPAASPHIRDSRDFSISPSHDFAPRDSDPLQFIESCDAREMLSRSCIIIILFVLLDRGIEKEKMELKNGIELPSDDYRPRRKMEDWRRG